ncbi:hypothetical protein D3C86_1640700 [compost metagenome]
MLAYSNGYLLSLVYVHIRLIHQVHQISGLITDFDFKLLLRQNLEGCFGNHRTLNVPGAAYVVMRQKLNGVIAGLRRLPLPLADTHQLAVFFFRCPAEPVVFNDCSRGIQNLNGVVTCQIYRVIVFVFHVHPQLQVLTQYNLIADFILVIVVGTKDLQNDLRRVFASSL